MAPPPGQVQALKQMKVCNRPVLSTRSAPLSCTLWSHWHGGAATCLTEGAGLLWHALSTHCKLRFDG